MKIAALGWFSFLMTSISARAKNPHEAESEYLQHRAAALDDRSDIAANQMKLSKKQAAKLLLKVGRVKALAGHLQTTGGEISRSDADEMNQTLTDVERALPAQK